MRVEATGTENYTDYDPFPAIPEHALLSHVPESAGTTATETETARREAVLQDAAKTMESANLKPRMRALAEKVIDRLRDGSVDDTSIVMIARGLQCLGKTKGDMGLDCSGFVKHLAQKADAPLQDFITAPGKNGCTQMKGSFEQVAAGDVKTGDIIFFNDKTDPQKTASHVGIVIVAQDGEKMFLHMTNHGVDINRLSDVASNETKVRWGEQFCGYARNPAIRAAA